MSAEEIQYHTLYHSNEQFHVRWLNGERKEEPYFLHYLFRPDGIWVCKTTDRPRIDPEEFYDDIDGAQISHDPDHDEPMNAERDLLYQSGRFELKNGTIYIHWKNTNLEEKKRSWYFRIRHSGLLETDFEEVQLLASGR